MSLLVIWITSVHFIWIEARRQQSWFAIFNDIKQPNNYFMFHQPPNMFFPLIRENGNAVFMEIEMDMWYIVSHTRIPYRSREPPNIRRETSFSSVCFSPFTLQNLRPKGRDFLLEILQNNYNYLTSVLAIGSSKPGRCEKQTTLKKN